MYFRILTCQFRGKKSYQSTLNKMCRLTIPTGNLFSSPTSRGGSLSPSVSVRQTPSNPSSSSSMSVVSGYNPDNPLAGVYSPKSSHVNPFFPPLLTASATSSSLTLTTTTTSHFGVAGDDQSQLGHTSLGSFLTKRN